MDNSYPQTDKDAYMVQQDSADLQFSAGKARIAEPKYDYADQGVVDFNSCKRKAEASDLNEFNGVSSLSDADWKQMSCKSLDDFYNRH